MRAFVPNHLHRCSRLAALAAPWSLLAVAGILAGSHCGIDPQEDAPSILETGELHTAPREETFHRCAGFTESRRPLFGELHVHTTYSLDANLEGTRLTPRDAYRFARGLPVTLPRASKPIRIDRPLDFAAITDHAEFLGFIGACNDRKSEAYRKKGCRIYRHRPNWALLVVDDHLTHEDNFHNGPRACGDAGEHCLAYRESMWLDLQNEAESHYDRTKQCQFTTFVGYEWSASPSDGTLRVGKVHNLHRNVIFRNSIVPKVPVDFFDAAHVEDLWTALRKHCLDTESGCDALTIPHNANLSAGRMFEEQMKDGLPFDAAYAQERAFFEPLMEIYQHKGSSECVPGQTFGDELCDFEIVPYDNLRAAKQDKKTSVSAIDTVRYGLGEGLRLARTLGTNPFAYGIVGGTDNHLGLAGNTNEALFRGGGGAGDMRLEDQTVEFPDRVYFGGGGLSVVWAEENSREAIFRALRRKETYGTSGTRMVVRFFGGDYPEDLCERRDFEEEGYRAGVPMGGTLVPGKLAGAPRFAVFAVQDSGTTELPGAELQRVQIVKGWLDAKGTVREKLFDVAGGSDNSTSVNPGTCLPEGHGHASLCSVWTDPEFDPAERAYYYARVLEVPACRWSTRMCVEAKYDCDKQNRPIDKQCCQQSAGLHPRDCRAIVCDETNVDDACCKPDVVRPVIQERAWTSPIWYEPPANAPPRDADALLAYVSPDEVDLAKLEKTELSRRNKQLLAVLERADALARTEIGYRTDKRSDPLTRADLTSPPPDLSCTEFVWLAYSQSGIDLGNFHIETKEMAYDQGVYAPELVKLPPSAAIRPADILVYEYPEEELIQEEEHDGRYRAGHAVIVVSAKRKIVVGSHGAESTPDGATTGVGYRQLLDGWAQWTAGRSLRAIYRWKR